MQKIERRNDSPVLILILRMNGQNQQAEKHAARLGRLVLPQQHNGCGVVTLADIFCVLTILYLSFRHRPHPKSQKKLSPSLS